MFSGPRAITKVAKRENMIDLFALIETVNE